MAIRASTDVGPVRVSVAPSTRARRTPAPARRVTVLKLPATRVPAGFALPRRADLPPPVAPAGWYPDPEDAARMRWWNGTKWTRRFADSGATPAAAPGTRVRARTADAPPRLRPARRPTKRRLLPNVEFSEPRGALGPVRRRRTRRSERD
ncbi:DUF2510 domain-containing protein [Tsukamurella tyrosinosolvens]|uniref:DUF2510 domain-containing protein n=1 Tax=Tsukamurella tyrosinosolvens TaxID=57704 RepID=UPI002DD451B7|nr:DUF2510 domain-containing protein [Tsukamurella tyrosinosolvens]MEC4613564.1 DUF2510 domain-containing protein [Tsukamurella tyrosinosolvens]